MIYNHTGTTIVEGIKRMASVWCAFLFNSKEQWKEPLKVSAQEGVSLSMGHPQMTIQAECIGFRGTPNLHTSSYYFPAFKQNRRNAFPAVVYFYISFSWSKSVHFPLRSTEVHCSSKPRVEASFWCRLLHSRPWPQSLHQQRGHLRLGLGLRWWAGG